MPQLDTDTICAIATSQGRSGVGIVRISGPEAMAIAIQLTGITPKPRYAHYGNFLDEDSEVIDQGIFLFFKGPHSFTGEDVVELQGHGGVYVLNALRDRVLGLGARLARPGEFSERAFMNNKIDLVQAEAIADLIDANSRQAVRSAMRTLQGEFSRQVNTLVERLTAIRVNVEAAIDFSDEDIDVLSDTGVRTELDRVLEDLHQTYRKAQQGAMLKEGMHVVIAGRPNAGKSSLMNALSGLELAIVTEIPGTTRDVLREQITVGGIPIHLIDTAGLRVSEDRVEQEGVRRAYQAIAQADRVLLVVDGSDTEQTVDNVLATLGDLDLNPEDYQHLLRRTSLIFNKCDLKNLAPALTNPVIYAGVTLPGLSLSAKTGAGLELLTHHLQEFCGDGANEEGAFTARERHLEALRKAENFIKSAQHQISEHSLLELVAEDLRLAQGQLGSITGQFSSDDLLGEIFASFCVGK
jgi:tRNA modification GTPase